MPLPRFDFVCVSSDEYPSSSTQVSYGRGYQFASAPLGPDQVVTRLHFPKGLWYFENVTTRVMSTTIQPRLNILALKAFYEDVRMYKTFEYVHGHFGLKVYRFGKPLVIPKINEDIAPGGISGHFAHQTEPFELQLILQP